MANRYASGVVQSLGKDGLSGNVLSDTGLLLPFKLAEETASSPGYIRGGNLGGPLKLGQKVTFTIDGQGNANNVKIPMISHRTYTQTVHDRWTRQQGRY